MRNTLRAPITLAPRNAAPLGSRDNRLQKVPILVVDSLSHLSHEKTSRLRKVISENSRHWNKRSDRSRCRGHNSFRLASCERSTLPLRHLERGEISRNLMHSFMMRRYTASAMNYPPRSVRIRWTENGISSIRRSRKCSVFRAFRRGYVSRVVTRMRELPKWNCTLEQLAEEAGLLWSAFPRHLSAFLSNWDAPARRPLSREHPITRPAWLTLPSCRASSNVPTVARMTFCS